MSKITRTGFALLLLLFLGNSSGNYAAQSKQKSSDASTGTLQKMIVENGSVTMRLDLNRLNEISSIARPATLHFATAANSFFSILVFNDQLRGPEPGSIALVAEAQPAPLLPASLAASLKQLVVEKFSPDAPFDFAVRDAKTGFTFFKIEGHQYDYQANAQVAQHHRRPAGDLEGIRRVARPRVRCRHSCGRNLHRRNHATRRDHTARREWRCEIRNAASTAPTRRRDYPRPGRHHRRADWLGAIGQWCSQWPRRALFGNRCLQQRDDRRGLVCLAEQRPSLYSAESLPNEWRH